MKYFVLLIAIVGVVSAQSDGGTDIDLDSLDGIMQFLAGKGIKLSSIVLSNCIMNGNPCSSKGDQPCCFSPIFSCQRNPLEDGAKQCRVIPTYVPNIPQITQVLKSFGMVTPNPVF